MGTPKYSNIAVAAILIFIGFGIVSVILWPPYPRVLRLSETEFRQATLRTVSGMVFRYADEHGGELPKPHEWFEAVMEIDPQFIYPEPIFGDNNQDDIWMCPIPWEDPRIPDDLAPYQLGKIPMLHEKVDLNADGTSVAFWDGSVRLLSNEEFAALVDVEDSVCLGCQFPVPEFLPEQGP